jgi:hypothetical protein
MGERNARRACGTGSPSKRDHSGGRVGQDGTASNSRDKGCVSADVRICGLSEDHVSASHLHAEDPWTGEAGNMLDGDTKKDAHMAVEIL